MVCSSIAASRCCNSFRQYSQVLNSSAFLLSVSMLCTLSFELDLRRRKVDEDGLTSEPTDLVSDLPLTDQPWRSRPFMLKQLKTYVQFNEALINYKTAVGEPQRSYFIGINQCTKGTLCKCSE